MGVEHDWMFNELMTRKEVEKELSKALKPLPLIKEIAWKIQEIKSKIKPIHA
jgi:hypothetical protein